MKDVQQFHGVSANEVNADIIRVKQLQVVDDQDAIRAVIGTTPAGGAGVVLFDETGKQRAELIHTIGQCSSLQFKAADGTLRASVTAQDNGECAVLLHDKEGTPRAAMSSTEDYDAQFSLLDKNGRPRITMSATSDYVSLITITDDADTPRIMLTVPATGEPLLVLLDEEGEPITRLP